MTLRPLASGLRGAAACLLLLLGAVPAVPFHAQASGLEPRPRPEVRLLVPIETGHEWEALLPTAPSAQLVQIEEREYVLLGSFADARVAYRLGRTLQIRKRLPFELAYDDGHPQRDGTWLARERGAGVMPNLASQAPMAPIQVQPAFQARKSMDIPPAPSSGAASMLAPVPMVGAPIVAVPVRSVAVTRPEVAAVNPSLRYLFVKLQSPGELIALQRQVAVSELTEVEGQTLARVGVYTLTPVGRRLLHGRITTLAAMGYSVVLLGGSA